MTIGARQTFVQRNFLKVIKILKNIAYDFFNLHTTIFCWFYFRFASFLSLSLSCVCSSNFSSSLFLCSSEKIVIYVLYIFGVRVFFNMLVYKWFNRFLLFFPFFFFCFGKTCFNSTWFLTFLQNNMKQQNCDNIVTHVLVECVWNTNFG